MKLEDILPDLEKEIGMIAGTSEWCPGVFHVNVDRGEWFYKEYYVVLDDAPLAAKLQNYGKKMNGFRLCDGDENASGWRIVQYEAGRYWGSVKGKLPPEPMFRDLGLHAMEVHPEYFGAFPAPYETPDGYTLRCRTLSNGIYWLETSTCRELLAVCFPIWQAELSPAAVTLGTVTERDKAVGVTEAMNYLFFTPDAGSVAIYELMERRQEWDGTVIHRPALMNALWEYAPEYALRLSGGKTGLRDGIGRFPDGARPDCRPQSDGKRLVGMFPGVGTDYILLK